MIVTAWNSGEHHSTGAGYGLKVNADDRDKNFDGNWTSVLLELEGRDGDIEVAIDKKSFWYSDCRELINKEIGVWLIENDKAPWPKENPPKYEMQNISGKRFRVSLID